jgi:hypothetical protein
MNSQLHACKICIVYEPPLQAAFTVRHANARTICIRLANALNEISLQKDLRKLSRIATDSYKSYKTETLPLKTRVC